MYPLYWIGCPLIIDNNQYNFYNIFINPGDHNIVNKKLFISLFCVFVYFICFHFSIFSSVNHVENLVVKSTPKTPKNKRLRLTDGLSDKAWKGEKGRNVLKIDLGEVQKFNTVRFKVKKDITFTEIKLKAGQTKENKVEIFKKQDVSASAGEWVSLIGFEVEARFINLTLKKKKPTIYELEIYQSQQDINGDGLDDFIAGAPYYTTDGGVTDLGRAYVFFGGETPNIILEGTGNSNFGSSVNIIGDVNNDSYADFIVGASLDNDTGRAYLYLGASTVTDPFFILDGAQDNSGFGLLCRKLGDINSDGFDDFLVAEPLHDLGSGPDINQGRVYVYFGGNPPDNIPDLLIDGTEDDEELGRFCGGGVGDINGDGFDDFFVGSGHHSGGGNFRGRVSVYFGGSNPDNIPDLVLDGDQDYSQFGDSNSIGLGDINNDGYDDFIVGAPYHDDGGADTINKGKAYIYLGGPIPDGTPDRILTGDQDGANFGISGGTLGDINGDGFDDFGIGADSYSAGGLTLNGRFYVYFGGNDINNLTNTFIDGNADIDVLGYSFANIGDVNQDGLPDFAVSSYFSQSGNGKIDIFLGDPAGFNSTPAASPAENVYCWFGWDID